MMKIFWLLSIAVFSLFPINRADDQCPAKCTCKNRRVTCKNEYAILTIPKRYNDLNFSGSDLRNFNTNCKLDNIEYLDLSNNPNIKLVPGSFCGMRYLKMLNLNGCNLMEIDNSWLKYLPSIEKLTFSNNNIASLPRFSSLSTLIELDLSRNRLTFLSAYIFQLNTFKKLSLSHNSLRFIDSKAFYYSSIDEVDLSFNQLSSIPKFGWNGKDITELIMDENPLSTLHYWSIEGMVNLRRLSLIKCNIKYIDPLIFSIKSIQFMDLRDNKLKYINGDFEEIDKLILNDNPWSCSCEILEMKNKIDNISKSLCENDGKISCIVCSTPDSFKNMHISKINTKDCSSSVTMSMTERVLTVVIPTAVLIILFILFVYLTIRLQLEKKMCMKKPEKIAENGWKNDTEPAGQSTPSPIHNPKMNLQRRLSKSVEDLRGELQDGHVNTFMRKGDSVDELRLFGPILAQGGTSTGMNSLNTSQRDISLQMNSTGVETIV